MQDLSLNELNALLEELESCVREYSAILVQELAYREELDFEQEQKDIFIARLNELHRRLERRRRLSIPPDNHIQLLSNSLLVKDYDEACTFGRNIVLDNMGSPSNSVHKEAPPFILRMLCSYFQYFCCIICFFVILIHFIPTFYYTIIVFNVYTKFHYVHDIITLYVSHSRFLL